MIGISKLYCGTVEPSDALRYNRQSGDLPSHLLQFSIDKKPVVVWNITRQCNLKCIHCYAKADAGTAPNELSTKEGMALIDDLAAMGVPVLLISGGEPLMRKDMPDLAAYAVKKGMRAVISTNGTLITKEKAKRLKDIGLSYVGISIDGTREINDKFRGINGAFSAAIDGVQNCLEAGIKVGLRFTINRFNAGEIPALFDILEEIRTPGHILDRASGYLDLINTDDTGHKQQDGYDIYRDTFLTHHEFHPIHKAVDPFFI